MKRLILVVLILGCGKEGLENKNVECKPKIPMWAFYYAWYGTPWVSGEWRHWNKDGHNPDNIENGYRDIASVRHPYPDVYDSSSPDVIKRHIELARKAKIDGFIFSWWGRNRTFEDNVLKKFAQISEEENFLFAIYYEGYFESYKNVTQTIVDDFKYLKRYFLQKNYIKIDGKPAIFIYGRAIFPFWWCLQMKCPEDYPPEISWAPILEKIKNEIGEIFAVADDISFFPENKFREKVIQMGFKALHAYNPYFESYLALEKTLEEHEKIFKDYVDDARKKGLWVGLSILPGYDDTKLNRAITWKLPRENGETLRKLYRYAVEANPDAILLVSFNEWHEGTEVEPSKEFGDFYIQELAKIRCEFGASMK